MFKVCLAELNICIENKYDYIKNQCREYITNNENTDFTVSVTEEEIDAESLEQGFEKGYLESLAIYRKIAERVIEYNGFLMHGVVLETDNTGIAFLAKSGTGKTTHAALWKKLLGDKMIIINGDKPLIRVQDGKVFAYGTPWAGKENIHKNMKTELKKVCFIERSEKNECEELDKSKVFPKLISYIYRSETTSGFLKTIEISGDLIENADFFITRCNMELSAAEVAYKKVANFSENS